MAHNRIKHRRVTPKTFEALLSRSGLSLRDYMAMTGRCYDMVSGFIAGTRQDYIPVMAEVLLLELAIRDRSMPQRMAEIVNSYIEGATPRQAAAVVEHIKRRF
jgi:hypothetical protein